MLHLLLSEIACSNDSLAETAMSTLMAPDQWTIRIQNQMTGSTFGLFPPNIGKESFEVLSVEFCEHG